VTILRRLLALLGSYGLACFLLLDLFLLTWFGTLYQVENGLFFAQKKYFESWFVVQSSPVPLVMPGGLLCMGLLAVNLFVGGLVRIQKSKRTIGVLVVHVGIALMLASGFVKLYHSEDGHLTLYEGQASDEFESYFLWEVVVWDAAQKGQVEEHLIPNEHLVDLVDGRSRTFSSPALPFTLELSGFLRNCRPLPKGDRWTAESPVVAGYALDQAPDELDAEFNIAGLVARFRAREGGAERTDLLWGREEHPATFEAGGKTWAVGLRHTRYPMPFTIRLEDFRKEDHPGMSMARSFESDVTKLQGGTERKLRIQMNEPLRDGGLVLFQASWGPSNAGPNDRLFSTFSVVRNPSDHWPLYSCIVIGIGLLLAFLPKLYKFVRAQNQSRARLGSAT
jgi:ResB-like family protein